MMVKHNTDKQSPAPSDNMGVLLVTLADTTWRMVVPPVLLTAAGLAGDLRWHTGLWLTLVGAAVGLALGALLVRQQLRGIR